MKATISANGKTVQVEMTEEQAKILGLAEERSRTGYERREECNNKKYYFVNTIDLVIEDENTVLFDQNRYDVGAIITAIKPLLRTMQELIGYCVS